MFSDTHGNYPLAVRIVEEAGPIDGIVHLGDGYDDASILEQLYNLPVIRVPGNCDVGVESPREICTTIAGLPVLITHGDAYNVKAGLDRIRQRAHVTRSRLVLYGHTHTPHLHLDDDVLFLNPGSLLPKGGAEQSFAIVSITGGQATATIHPVFG